MLHNFGLTVLFCLIVLNHTDAALSQEQILSLAKNGLFDSAQTECHVRLKADSQEIFSLNLLGKLTTKGEDSYQYYQKVLKAKNIEKYPAEREAAYYKLGQYFYARGQYIQAISFFKKNIFLFPKGDAFAQNMYWAGNACLNYSRVQEAFIDSAEAVFTELLRILSPKQYYYSLALEGMAKVRMHKNQLESAEETVNMALETASEDQKPGLYFLMYDIAKKQSKVSLQASWKEKIVARYPGSLEGRYLGKKSSIVLPKPISDKSLKSGFALQVGAFLKKENAENTAKKLKQKDITVDVFETKKESKSLFLLHTLIFSTRQSAEQYGEKVLKPQNISYYVVAK
ncbi:MAG: SPOR domain-containing protein [Fibrobacteria bacterium]|nr:SPOR domain-containing protein [Fibrobacteria bacterium]